MSQFIFDLSLVARSNNSFCKVRGRLSFREQKGVWILCTFVLQLYDVLRKIPQP